MGYFLQFHLESIGHQEKLLDYQLTIFFLYLYFRIVLHAITHQVLKSTSPIYANMPDGLQRDCAFMCVDGPSFFMWMPLTLYLVVVILHEQNLQAVSMRVGPLLYVGSVAYQLDRLFHLFNVFRVDRLIRHSLTCIWMLLVLEWTPESFRDYSFIMFAFTMDICAGRVTSLWFLVARLARRHARQCTASITSWELDAASDGADQVLIPRSPQRMALYGRLLYRYEILTSFVAPVILESIYLYRYNDEIHLMWKIMVFPMMAVYLTLDKAIWDNFSKFSKESYWLHLLRSPPPESHPKDDQNEKKDTTTSS